MPLVQTLAAQISSRSRARGRSYFQSGAVRALTVEDGIVHATVRGSTSYDVWLEPERALLRVSCTCPYFVDHLEICKHVWAAILAAEAQAVPLVAPGIAPREVVLDPVHPDQELSEIDVDLDLDESLPEPDYEPRRISATDRQRLSARMKEYWAAQRRGDPRPPVWQRPRAARASLGRAVKRPTRPAISPRWRQVLDQVGAAIAPAATPSRFAPGQLLYVIDVPATRASGALVLELMTRDRKRNGEWGKPRPARVIPSDIHAHPASLERHMLERLAGARGDLEYVGYEAFGRELTRVRLRGVLVSDLVPLLCATGQCVLRLEEASDRTGALSAPLAWDDADPWTFTMAISGGEATRGYVIEGWLERGGERLALTDPVLVLADGIALTHTHAARLEVSTSFAWLAAMRADSRNDARTHPAPRTTRHRDMGIAVPATAREHLLDMLVTSSPTLAAVPDDLRLDIVNPKPSPAVRLFPIPARPDRVRAELVFDYAGTPVPFDSPQPVIRSPGSTRVIRRDLEVERQSLELLTQHGCRREWNYGGTSEQILQLPSQAVPRLVRQLVDEGWRVEASGRLYRRPGAIALGVRSGIDWFELHGRVDYGDQHVSLPALLAALDRGETFVTLDDGTYGLLPEEWLQRHAMVARLGSASGDHLRFRRTQVALLDTLIAAQPEASWDDTFARARAQLKAFDGIQPLDPPDTFVGTLRGYQREGLGWLVFLERFGFGGCLADDMGLGKTVMVLALLCTRAAASRLPDAPASRNARRGAAGRPGGHRPSLVVAPRSVIFNWREEASRFAPGLRVLEYLGIGRAAMRAALGDYDVVLTTYGTLRRDAEALSGVDFEYVILDEAQAVKNAASVSAKAARVLNGRHRLALSGTPIENHLGELWSLFEFLNPGLLGTSTTFTRAGTSTGQALDEDTVALLSRALRPFILRRTKAQVASDLPAKTEQTLYCELERPQRALYDELRGHYRRTLLDNGSRRNGWESVSKAEPAGRTPSKLQVLEALLRLRQAACHPGLLDARRLDEPSAKLDVLVPRLSEAIDEGHKVLVFSQFTSLLAILRRHLDARGMSYEYLDGRTRDRQARVDRFQTDPACRLFLVSLKAGGLGLNLTAAEYVFLLDPWWNPAVEAQAVDRAHRIGQSRHVFAYRLIARDTVEERVLELQQRKRQLADAILTADHSLIRNLQREDLEWLLS